MVIVETGSSQGYFCCFMSLCFFFLLPSIAQVSTLMVVADLQVSGQLQFVWFHKMMIHDHDDLKCNMGLFLIPIWIQKPTEKICSFLGLASSGSKLANAQISPFPWLKSSPPCMIGLEF